MTETPEYLAGPDSKNLRPGRIIYTPSDPPQPTTKDLMNPHILLNQNRSPVHSYR